MTEGSRISIAHIPVSGPKDYERSSRAVGENLSFWPHNEAERGPARLYFPLATELVVMEGVARLDGGERLCTGDLVRVPADSELRCEVEVPLGLRMHTPSTRALGDALHEVCERLRSRPSVASGRFVRATGAAQVTLAPATYVTAQPRGGDDTLARGPLFDALFALPAAQLTVMAIALADEAASRWDCLFSFTPTGLRYGGPRARPPVVEQLRATGLPAFGALESLNVMSEPELGMLSRAASLLALDAAGALDAAETLLVERDDGWWRWQSDRAGTPFAEAIAPWLAPSSAPCEPPAGLEPLVEYLLASLWADDGQGWGWILNYMSHPVSSPWPVGALACPFASQLSPTFRVRWGIELTCDGDASALPGDDCIRIGFHGRAGDVTEWTVRSDYFHEHVEWRYRVTNSGGVFTHTRELLSQWD